MPVPLIIMSLGSFAFGLANYITAGIVPLISTYFGVTEGQAGYVASIYTAGICVGAPLFVISTVNINKKYLLLLAIAVFSVINLVAGFTSDFNTLLIARFVAGMCAGLFIGLTMGVAVKFVPPEKASMAVSVVLLGSTLSAAFGVPVGAYLTNLLGYSFAFLSTSVFALVIFFGLVVFVPTHTTEVEQKIELKSLLPFISKVLFDVKLVFAYTLIATTWGSVFFMYTFITPVLRDVPLIPVDVIEFFLIAFGLGFVAGNILGGKTADNFGVRNPLVVSTALVFLFYIMFYFILQWGNYYAVSAGLFLWGGFAYFVIPLLQTCSIRLGAKHGKQASIIISSFNMTSFNVGVAVYSYFGGVTMTHYGVQTVVVAPIFIALFNLVLVVLFYFATKNDYVLTREHIHHKVEVDV